MGFIHRLSEAAEDAFIDGMSRRSQPKRDWHIVWRLGEPSCGKNQWRRRDRCNVIKMRDMGDDHLNHAIRFASTMQQHASRLSGLLAEKSRRSKK